METKIGTRMRKRSPRTDKPECQNRKQIDIRIRPHSKSCFWKSLLLARGTILFLLHKIVDRKIVDQPLNLVTFGHLPYFSVTFGLLFRVLFQLTVYELDLLKTSLFGKN